MTDLDAGPPWRLDVPEVPAHVTALKDGNGTIWIRVPEVDRWARWQVEDAHLYALRELLVFGPLVECPDPRAAS